MVHEWAHKKFCNWNGVKVNKVKYFTFGNPAGYVEHEPTVNFKQTFWISIGPLIINSILVIIFSFLAFRVAVDPRWYWVFLWLAFSIGMHSFPSNHDMKNISNEILHGGHILYYLAFPLIWLIWIANFLRLFWFDAVYSLVLIILSFNLFK
jgi:hypothetical protein